MPKNDTQESGALHDSLFRAYETVLDEKLEDDCVMSTWSVGGEELTIEFGNFSDGLVFNVANLPRTISAEQFKRSAPQEVIDDGEIFIAFRPNSEDADTLVAETMQIASFVDGELVDVQLRHIENMPDWFPEKLLPWKWGDASA